MRMQTIVNGVDWLGAIDWDRRLFDSLIPLPDGTSYNAYLIQGSEKTALLDTVDLSMGKTFLRQIEGIDKIDYVVSHHAEPDHSGMIPVVMERFPEAKLIATSKGKTILQDMFSIADERFHVVKEGDGLDLGGKNLVFHLMPWVHWPETMVSYLKEDKILFTCDLFGSHLATTDLYSDDKPRVLEAAKRYYAEIMMPFRSHIRRYLEKINTLDVDIIAPSHGPIHRDTSFILDVYKEWTGDAPKNLVAVLYISMHGSTRMMVELLVEELSQRKIKVQQYDLTTPDIGKVAETLVDAATIVIATPTVLTGPHPNVAYAVFLANLLKPKAQFATVIGSLSWGGKVVEQVSALIPNLKVEVLEPVLLKGKPDEKGNEAIRSLASTIASKHKDAGIM